MKLTTSALNTDVSLPALLSYSSSLPSFLILLSISIYVCLFLLVSVCLSEESEGNP